MARFIGYVQGQSGEASRIGSPRSGIRAQAQGWNVGVQVHGHADGDEDVFDIYMTGGSNGGGNRPMGRIRIVDGVPRFTVADTFKVHMDGGSPVVVI